MTQRKVQCWIFSHDGKTQSEYCLLLKTNPARGSFWQPVTGTVEDNEGFFEAACREPLEETGFRFERAPQDTGFEFEFTSRFGQARERVFGLVAEMGCPTPILDPNEHDSFEWVTPQKALSLVRFPSNIDGLRKAYRLVFGKELETASQ